MEKPQDDDRVMSLVELALGQPLEERESYLRDACAGDAELFCQAWDYVQWEDRMQGFLLDPIYSNATAERQFEPGELLDGRFRILRQIAQGGMGIVYEATDEKLGRHIALKCAKAGFRQRLPPEVLHASEISHPNVCRTFEIHTASTSHGEIDFLTMEFLDGETLTARLRRGPVPEAEAREIAMQISQGLAEAHRNRVVHGDLKSNNVILARSADGSVRAVITDFGLARGRLAAMHENASPAGGSSEAGGTPDYMAPELWKGGKATPASDVYALGIILYELITGHRPFGGAPPLQPLAARRPPPTHSRWDPVLARCLDPDPSKRCPGAVQVAQALEPKHTWRWWLAAAAAVALAAGVGTITYQRATAPQESIRLALLPLESSPDDSTLAASVSQGASQELARLKGGKRARLTVVSPAEVTRRHVDSTGKAQSVLSATHVLRGKLTRANGHFIVHALLTDARTQANNGDWEFIYAPGELRYAPVALAGVATAALRLPPLAVPEVSAAAKRDYLAGLANTRQNSTIDMALPLLERAVQADPDSPLTWAGLAEAQWFKYFIAKDPAWLDRTSESLRQAQRRDPDLATVHRVAGLLSANSGVSSVAEAEYQRAMELEPANAENYWRLGQVYENNNRLDQALTALKKAVELDQNYFRVYLQLGAFYLRRGDLTEAVRQFENSVQRAQNEPETHYALGTAYSDQGRWAEAERELRLAIAPGGTPSALNNLANVLISQGKDPEAIPFLVRALEQFPDRYRWRMNLGDAYGRTGQPALSTQAYRRALDLADKEMNRDPSDGGIRACVAYLSARLGDRKRAETEIAQALHFSPDADTRLMAVWTYEALHKHSESLAILANVPDEVLAEAVYLPNLAELRQDSRFKELLSSHHIKGRDGK
jgi:serine/threonine protein kinase/Flp pilus assembly protein TadD